MNPERTDIRLALPSKGRLAESTLEFFTQAGLRVHKPNPRQFKASIPSLPEVTVLFQRPGDIAVSVRDGSVDFGVLGWDTVSENQGGNSSILPLHLQLGFGHCSLHVIVPESWESVHTMADLAKWENTHGKPPRVATKFPTLTRQFFARHDLPDVRLIHAEGTLEVAPAIGYADIIVDLVSTGTTLRDNRLRTLDDGEILTSQACLIANFPALQARSDIRRVARLLLEFIEAHLRAIANVALFANMRGTSPEAIAEKMFTQSLIGGLQGPTISPVITRQGKRWYAVNIIVRKDQLAQAITELRSIGGSDVVVTPVSYIFEEEPEAYRAMLDALERAK